MIRTICILIIVALLSLCISWVADEPGRVIIYWSSYRVDTSVMFLLAATAIISLSCLLFYILAGMVLQAPRNFRRASLAKHQTLGLEALTETFIAIAAQDINLAHKKLRKAKSHLPKQAITLMLSAQLARLEGDEEHARAYIEQMLGNETTKFIALRNLVENAKSSNDDAHAIDLGKQALALKPQDNWLIATLAELYAKTGQMEEASHLLESSYKKRYISKQFFRRETAHMLYESAKSFTESGHVRHAISSLQESLRKLPDFPQAAAMLAELHVTEDNLKEGLKTLAKAWNTMPHPHLRETITKILQKHREDENVLSSVQKIARMNPEHKESRLLVKEINDHAA